MRLACIFAGMYHIKCITFWCYNVLEMIKTYAVMGAKKRWSHFANICSDFDVLLHPYMKTICAIASLFCIPLFCISLDTIFVRCMCIRAKKNYDHFTFRENCFSEHDFHVSTYDVDVCSIYMCAVTHQNHLCYVSFSACVRAHSPACACMGAFVSAFLYSWVNF